MNGFGDLSRAIDRSKLSRHDAIVSLVAEDLERQKFLVWANHIDGYERPDPVPSGRKPDIFAKRDDEEIIVEAETSEGLGSEETKKQVADFANYARQRGATFYLAVSSMDSWLASYSLTSWGVRFGKVYTVPNNKLPRD